MRKLKTIKSEHGRNSLLEWKKARNPLRVSLNFVVIQLCKYLPSLSLKRFLLRGIGMKIGKNVSIGLAVQFDIFFPELITLEDNCIVGYNATILCHEFLVEELRIGEIKIGENALIGANSTVLPGTCVGKNARVSAMSLVNKDVKDNSLVGGIPVKELKVQR